MVNRLVLSISKDKEKKEVQRKLLLQKRKLRPD